MFGGFVIQLNAEMEMKKEGSISAAESCLKQI